MRVTEQGVSDGGGVARTNSLRFVRRHFVKLAGGGLVTTLVGLGVAVPSAGGELDGGERALLRAVLSRFCAGHALGLADPELEHAERSAVDGIARFLSESIRFVPSLLRDFRVALLFLEHAPLITGRWARFSGLSPEEQEDVLSGLMRSESALERDVFVAFKSLTTLFFYEEPSVIRRIGYDQPPLPTLAGAP